jgi:hypothetical protein
LPGIERAPITRPSFNVVTIDTFTPNSWRALALPLLRHSTNERGQLNQRMPSIQMFHQRKVLPLNWYGTAFLMIHN